MAYLAVNKGKAIAVYKQNVANSPQIGTIYPNEAFLCFGDVMANGKVGVGIQFRNSSGNLVYGGIPSQDGIYRKAVKGYPFGTATVFGVKRDVFKMRRQEKIVRPDGSLWGYVAAGSLVVVDPNSLGETTKFVEITYVQKSNGTWQKVAKDSTDPAGTAQYSYGFLDHGLDHGSFNDTISMYGTWG